VTAAAIKPHLGALCTAAVELHCCLANKPVAAKGKPRPAHLPGGFASQAALEDPLAPSPDDTSSADGLGAEDVCLGVECRALARLLLALLTLLPVARRSDVLHRASTPSAAETGDGGGPPERTARDTAGLWALRRSPGERLLYEYVAQAAACAVEVLRALAVAGVLPTPTTAAALLAPRSWAPALKDAPKSPLLQVRALSLPGLVLFPPLVTLTPITRTPSSATNSSESVHGPGGSGG
jgi:hypothetical protein